MRIFFHKEGMIPLSICALILGPSINFYLNDIIQYVYGGASVSALIYILLGVIGFRSYLFLSKQKRLTKSALITVFAVLACLLFSYVLHPSIGEVILAPDFNPLRSIGLFLLFFGFPLMIYCSLEVNWNLLLRYLFYFSVVDIILAGLDYSWVMLRISMDDVNYMSFSYNQLVAASVCAVYGYKEKKIIPFLISIVSLVLIFFGGARGPLGCLLVLYMLLIAYPFSARRILIISGVALVMIIGGPMILNKILSGSADVISDIGGFSRTLYKITEGDLLQSDSRDNLSTIIENAIGANPLGYGLLGDRFILKQHGMTGYAHNVVLELLCDFGWLLGPVIFVIWIVNILKVFFNKNRQDSFYFYLALVPAGCLMLFVSGSFVEEFAFWALLGVVYHYKSTHSYKLLART